MRLPRRRWAVTSGPVVVLLCWTRFGAYTASARLESTVQRAGIRRSFGVGRLARAA